MSVHLQSFKNEFGNWREKWRLIAYPDEFQLFGRSFFQNQSVFFFYRLFAASYFTFVLGWSWEWAISHDEFRFWFIYLTHWSLFVEWCYLVLGAIISYKVYYNQFDNFNSNKELPLIIKIQWTLQNIIVPVSFLVFLLFWGLVFDGDTLHPLSPQTHGMNFCIVLIDIFFGAQPYRIVHIWQAMVYSGVYLIWTFIFDGLHLRDADGNPYIYSTLSYSESSGAYLTAFLLIFFAVPMVGIFLWWIWYFGQVIGRKNRTLVASNGDIEVTK